MPGVEVIIEGKSSDVNLSIQDCLEGLGISTLIEWDVLTFIYCRRLTLTSVDVIANLIGYEHSVVETALNHLEAGKLIERSRTSQGVFFYRMSSSTDAGHRFFLQHLVLISESRAGRVLLAKQLRFARSESGRKGNREPVLESERGFDV